MLSNVLVGAVLSCFLLACSMTTWKPAGPLDIKEGSEIFVVTTARAIQLRDAYASGSRVQGQVVHMWELPAGGVHVPVYSGDSPSDIARRGG
jgi:hypothetical protein